MMVKISTAVDRNSVTISKILKAIRKLGSRRHLRTSDEDRNYRNISLECGLDLDPDWIRLVVDPTVRPLGAPKPLRSHDDQQDIGRSEGL